MVFDWLVGGLARLVAGGDGAVGHGCEAFLKTVMVFGITNAAQDLKRPIGEIGVQAVVDPLATPLISNDVAFAQLAKVAGNVWLGLCQRMHQFADTQFALVQ